MFSPCSRMRLPRRSKTNGSVVRSKTLSEAVRLTMALQNFVIQFFRNRPFPSDLNNSLKIAQENQSPGMYGNSL